MTKMYECKFCNFKNGIKGNLDRHKKTTKHKNNIKVSRVVSCECGEEFNKPYNLSRHKKICHIERELSNDKELEDLKHKVERMKEFQLFKDDLLEQQRVKDEQHKNELIKAYESCKIPTTNTTNNIICSEEFLKKHCSEAMNLPEFIESIVLGINDILYSGKHGYELGMANILNTRLKTLGSSKRPIHCTDTKRKKFVIKSENKWRCDKDNELLLEGVKKLDNKQYSMLKNWDDKEHDTDTFFEVVQGVTPTDSTKKLLKGLTSYIEMKVAMNELGYIPT